jgi:alkanesulfonate monooxygenase SsuD/methylene tetrahydromethanopterin reductase-like flavin-dependent oxidoreductase (luciferase family)
MPDHVVFGTNVQYPWGGWQIDPAESWPEPVAVLAAAAGATRHVALVTNVLIAPLRSAPLLAKQVATLHGLSRGRFELGVGAGWQREEYEASGLSFDERSEILFDQLRACRTLWRERPASFRSRHVNFAGIWCSPSVADDATGRPLQLWFGVAPTAGNARLFTEFPNAGWSCIDPDPAVIARGRARLELALAGSGARAPSRTRAAPPLAFSADGHLDVAATIANLPASVRAGVTEFDFPLLFVEKTRRAFDELLDALARIERSIDRYS